MTWNPRRKGWLKPTREPTLPIPPKQEAIMPTVAEDILIVPDIPSFSPSAIAVLLQQSRQAVNYWMMTDKIKCYRDNIGAPYVLRPELIRFVREYLRRDVHE